MKSRETPQKIHPDEARELLHQFNGVTDEELTLRDGISEVFRLSDGRMLAVTWLPTEAYTAGGILVQVRPNPEIGDSRLYLSREAMLEDDRFWDEYNEDAVARAGDWANTAWDKERGIHCLDYNNGVILVHETVEVVAQAIAEEYRPVRWERDVVDREVLIGHEAAFLFRLRGHAWTEIVDQVLASRISNTVTTEYARTLSRRLKTRVIFYEISDTVSYTHYTLFDAGEVLEEFTQEGETCNKFESMVRTATARELYYVHDFVDAFFRSQDALEPGIAGYYFLDDTQIQPGKRIAVQNPGFALRVGDSDVVTTPEIERVDYFVFSDT